jgi:1,4-dihydroxy-2-naphthoate octaprenyltransferase
MHGTRHGEGVRATLSALASQVHPVFMLPPLAAAAFGAVLAGQFDLAVAVVHLAATFLAVYTAHLKDGYVDFHVRGEDDDHPLTARGCRAAIAAASAGFFLALAALAVVVGPLAAGIVLPAWLIAYLHAPQLDTNPVTTTTGYPLGIAISLLGGYYVQAQALAVRPLAVAGVLLVLLSGVKIIDDAQDFDYDQSIGKHTVAVVLGRRRARRLAFRLMAAAMVGVVGLVVLAVFPPSAVAAVLAFGAVAAFAARAEPTIATMLLVRGCYVFLAVFVAAVWYQPLA